LLVPRLRIVAGHGFQAPSIAPGGDTDEHLLDHAAVQRVDIGHGLECWPRDLVATGTHAWPLPRDLPAAEDHLTAHRAGARGLAVGHVRIPRTADGDAVLFEHRV
jgi:hypothetical protein